MVNNIVISISSKECLNSELELVKNAALGAQRFGFVFVMCFGLGFFIWNVFLRIVFVNQAARLNVVFNRTKPSSSLHV